MPRKAPTDQHVQHNLHDCDFRAADGFPGRFWCRPRDPDPVIAQVGAVRLLLIAMYDLRDTHRAFVIPLATALSDVAAFTDGDTLLSRGKDDFNMMAISCHVQGIAPPLPATRFGNVSDLMLRAGMPHDDVIVTRSSTLTADHKVDHPPLRAQDALDDALSVTYAVQHLLRQKRLTPNQIALSETPPFFWLK